MDLPKGFRSLSSRQSGLTWTAFVAVLVLLLVVDVWLREPFRVIDVLLLAIGGIAVFNAIHNEAGGSYHAKSRIVTRDREPAKFRAQTLMLIALGVFLAGAGAVLQAWGLAEAMTR